MERTEKDYKTLEKLALEVMYSYNETLDILLPLIDPQNEKLDLNHFKKIKANLEDSINALEWTDDVDIEAFDSFEEYLDAVSKMLDKENQNE